MTEPHTCDFWLGVCSCGKSRRPVEENNMPSKSEVEKVALIERFGFDQPPVNLPALYQRFEKDAAFHELAQFVADRLSPNGQLEVDEILRVTDRLDEVLRERL